MAATRKSSDAGVLTQRGANVTNYELRELLNSTGIWIGAVGAFGAFVLGWLNHLRLAAKPLPEARVELAKLNAGDPPTVSVKVTATTPETYGGELTSIRVKRPLGAKIVSPLLGNREGPAVRTNLAFGTRSIHPSLRWRPGKSWSGEVAIQLPGYRDVEGWAERRLVLQFDMKINREKPSKHRQRIVQAMDGRFIHESHPSGPSS